MLSSRSLSRCLQSGYHCCRKAKNLKIESEARRRKICSIIILLRVVHKVQAIEANTSQKRHLLLPGRFACTSRNSPTSKACHSGPRASATKLQKKAGSGTSKHNMVRCLGDPTQRAKAANHVSTKAIQQDACRGMNSRDSQSKRRF
jgi:hypothetical protein